MGASAGGEYGSSPRVLGDIKSAPPFHRGRQGDVVGVGSGQKNLENEWSTQSNRKNGGFKPVVCEGGRLR